MKYRISQLEFRNVNLSIRATLDRRSILTELQKKF